MGDCPGSGGGDWRDYDQGYQEFAIECPKCYCIKVTEIHDDNSKYNDLFLIDVGETGRCNNCRHRFKALRRHLKEV